MAGDKTDDLVVQIHTELVGMDGRSGIVGEMRDAKKSRTILHTKADEQEAQLVQIQTKLDTTVVTKKECKETREKIEVKKDEEKKWNWKKRMGYFTLQIALAGGIFTAISFLQQCGGS